MKDYKIILAGFGGQGILFLGKVIAYAGLMEGHEVSWLPSYGPEMRGGTANCSVCISEEAIASPLIINPNILIAMNQPSYDKFIDAVEPGATVIIDSTLVEAKKVRDDIQLFCVPATELAEENGLKGLANIILLGKLFEETGLVSYEGLEKGIRKSVPARKQNLVESNLKAIQIGQKA